MEFNMIIEKPWGKEEILENNNKYVLKKLTMYAGHRCSLQFHKFKKETVFVLSGRLKIIKGSNLNSLEENIYISGDFITIPPKLIHRMEGVEDSVYLEASTSELDDVFRLADDYKRV